MYAVVTYVALCFILLIMVATVATGLGQSVLIFHKKKVLMMLVDGCTHTFNDNKNRMQQAPDVCIKLGCPVSTSIVQTV